MGCGRGRIGAFVSGFSVDIFVVLKIKIPKRISILILLFIEPLMLCQMTMPDITSYPIKLPIQAKREPSGLVADYPPTELVDHAAAVMPSGTQSWPIAALNTLIVVKRVHDPLHLQCFFECYE